MGISWQMSSYWQPWCETCSANGIRRSFWKTENRNLFDWLNGQGSTEMTRALVTGATGFVGHHVVKHLTQLGIEVNCLVRPTSDLSRLQPYKPRYLFGDVTDAASVTSATDDIDWVFHVAGLTKSLKRKDLLRVNAMGSHNVAEACARQDNPPTLVSVSSVAACGPSSIGHPLNQQTIPAPVSNYGRSKLAGEHSVSAFRDQVPLTIVRPPIVIGDFDRDGFQLYESIYKYGWHLVPTWSDHEFSIVHADDLAAALVLAADKGQRLSDDATSTRGIYYVAPDEIVTYRELGRLIGDTVGRSHARVICLPSPLLWTIGCFF